MITLLLFFRDLRLEDHSALAAARFQDSPLLPCFIFTPGQATQRNTYKSDTSFYYMIQSLKSLHKQIADQHGQLYCFYGSLEKTLHHLCNKNPITSIFCHYDYTSFAKNRQDAIEHFAKKNNIECHFFHDYLLTTPGTVVKKDSKPYVKFTPFFKAALQHVDNTPRKTKDIQWHTKLIISKELTIVDIEKEGTKDGLLLKKKPLLFIEGGLENAKKIIKKAHDITSYEKIRDIPSEHTTHFSALLKFGVVSVRSIYNSFSNKPAIIRQLVWRDFFTHIAYFFPHVFEGAFYKKFDRLSWQDNAALFTLWKEGNTGYPLVDAGMRQLNTVGYMPNRVRLITASLLVKNLHIHWKKGEQYFAQHLIDYDPSVNNGNWQWVAGTGCDTMPYFRIFNPWIAQKKFDPQGLYIKQWIPELASVEPTTLHNPYKQKGNEYPMPCVDYKLTAEKFLKTIRHIL